MKTYITGPNSFSNYGVLKSAIENIYITEIVSGGGKGMDSLAERYASEKKIPVSTFSIQWNDMSEPCHIKTNKWGKEYNALAGFKRNNKIADYANGLIAIESKETEQIIERMFFLDKFVFLIKV